MEATNRFSGNCVHSSGGFRKAICCSLAALEQLLALQQEGLGKSVKILKHFARGKLKLVYQI
jgi:hypothetical protein